MTHRIPLERNVINIGTCFSTGSVNLSQWT